MMPAILIIAGLAAAASGIAAGLLWRQLRRRGVDQCIVPYLLQSGRRAGRAGRPVHVLLCVADHFEPKCFAPSPEVAARRVQTWMQRYPRMAGPFRDSDGRPPRHTFFFPIDQYEDEHVRGLAALCRRGFGEVEIHLHHDHDTPENLRRTLEQYKLLFAQRHGLLSRRRKTDEIAYGFIHGNWALCNSDPDGQWCGVNNELDVLRETGCYADFTLPSAPNPMQTRKINSIYYASNRPNQPKSHDRGLDVGRGPAPANSLMLIQGPLLLDWPRRRIENGCLQASQPPDMHRLERWLGARVHVPRRKDWLFVKLHTHGAPEANQEILLGEPMIQFHLGLQRRAVADSNFHYHYVTAREMYNLARAAETGYDGTVADALDYELVPNLLERGRILAAAG